MLEHAESGHVTGLAYPLLSHPADGLISLSAFSSCTVIYNVDRLDTKASTLSLLACASTSS
jgi:hypothetical protein